MERIGDINMDNIPNYRKFTETEAKLLDLYENTTATLTRNHEQFKKDIAECTDKMLKSKIIISYLQEQCIIEHDLNLNIATFLKEIGINIVD
ncbi:MAG: hypothetical protein R3Y29_01760 [bacterium]